MGDFVPIPISQPDKISALGPRNILGCITSRDDFTYSIGISQGTLAVSTVVTSLKYVQLIFSQLIPSLQLPLLRRRQCKVYHLVSQIVQLANVRIAKLRDVPAGKLAEAAILNAIKGVLVLTSTPNTSSC